MLALKKIEGDSPGFCIEFQTNPFLINPEFTQKVKCRKAGAGCAHWDSQTICPY